MYMIVLFVLFIGLFSLLVPAQNDGKCKQLEGDTRSCILISECEMYYKLLQQSQTNTSAVQILKDVHCGFDGNIPKVCCLKPNNLTMKDSIQSSLETKSLQSSESARSEDFVSAFPEPPVCGVSNASFNKVVNGENAKLGDFPWMALLGYKQLRGSTDWLCGGTLISSHHILTVAHCINYRKEDLYLVRLGELDLAREDEGAVPVDVLIKTKIMHEEYDDKTHANDIGILVLDRDVQFTDLIKPICIPLDPELRVRSFVGYTPFVAGWGRTEYRGPSATQLQALQLPVVTNEECARAYSQNDLLTIDKRVLCAGYKNGGKDACIGDSGGPLMQPIWNAKKFVSHIYQIGVVSFGKECAKAGFPGVYTRVTEFIPWLQSKVIASYE